ncbi:FecR family protein [Phenylobacterium sp.]|uniref:FecR family protein n=1 Tax=Phenylobacterium sp. TaxID=1871053 RepID=UPI003002ED66
MRSVKVALAALLSTTILFGAGGALAAEWRLTEVTGRVRVAAPGQSPATGAPNQAVPVGADITTAAGGRAVLTNGAQRIVIGPNSRMTVANGEGAGMTRIMQDLGSILFQVDKQSRPHFRVDTPLLAAVVKGTTFTVAIGAKSDTVHVAEGLVEVRANGGGGPQDIPAGVTGRVMRDGPAQVGVITPTATPAPAEAVQALPPLDYSQVSDGVVAGPGAPAGLDTARNAAAPQGQSALSAASGVGNLSGGNGDSSASNMAAARATAAAIGQPPAQIAANGNGPPSFAGPSQGGDNGDGNGPGGANPGNANSNGNGPGADNAGGNGNGNGGPAGGPAGPEGANPGNGNGNGPGASNGAGNGAAAGADTPGVGKGGKGKAD